MKIVDWTQATYYVAQVKGGKEVKGSRIEVADAEEQQSTLKFLASIEPRNRFIPVTKHTVLTQDRLI